MGGGRGGQTANWDVQHLKRRETRRCRDDTLVMGCCPIESRAAATTTLGGIVYRGCTVRRGMVQQKQHQQLAAAAAAADDANCSAIFQLD